MNDVCSLIHSLGVRCWLAARLISGCLSLTPVPWLPVLAGIVILFYAIKWQLTIYCAVSNLLKLTTVCRYLNSYSAWLTSLFPIRSDVTTVDITAQWREGRLILVYLINQTTVTNPTIWQPGFDLPRHTTSLLNYLQTGQGPCLA